jgi:predicted dehydrogenase
MSDTSRLRIGVIGAGVLGGYHADKARKSTAVTLAGIHDLSTERLHAAATKLGTTAFERIEDLLGAVNAVIVATPASTHRDIALACLRAGRHVLVEKPLADSHESGSLLVEEARKRGLVLHVGHSEVFNPAFQKLMSWHPQPRFMEIHRLAEFSPRGTDVSVIFDLMVHDLDLVHRLTGEEPRYDAIAAAGVAVLSRDIDIANVRLPFPSGCVVNLTASRISTARMRKLRVFQEKNYFSVDLDKREIVRCALAAEPTPGRMPFNMSKETIDAADALEAEQAAFAQAIASEGAPTLGTTGVEALHVIKMADVIMAKLSEQQGSEK